MTAQLPPENELPPRRWPWWVAGIAAALVVALALVWMLTRSDGTDTTAETPVPTTSAPAPTEPTSTESVNDDPAPTGCLGGQGRDADMFLDAQAKAPHSANGAVEAAAAMVRFIMQRPYPSIEDQQAVTAAGIAEGSGGDLVELYEGNPTIAENAAPADANVAAYTANGAWYLNSYTDEHAVVSIAYYWLSDGRQLGNYGAVVTYVMVWEDEGWKLDSVKTPEYDANQIVNEMGTPFTGGC